MWLYQENKENREVILLAILRILSHSLERICNAFLTVVHLRDINMQVGSMLINHHAYFFSLVVEFHNSSKQIWGVFFYPFQGQKPVLDILLYQHEK